jgi:DNA-binding response OmpR family regulator
MVTAQDGPEHAVRALEAGCDDYIEKPIRPDELLLRVERVLRRAAEDAAD